MTEHSGMGPIDFTVDTDNLYLEEIFTDFKAGNIRKLTPVDLEGEEDSERDVLFFGQTRMMTQNGPIQLQAALDAGSLEEAVEVFPEAMQQVLEDTIEKMNGRQTQQKGH